MFAIVRTGGKQYRVAADQEITVDRMPGDIGARVELESLAFAAGDAPAVTAEIVAHTRGEKIIVFKKKRRHNYRRKNGHRQNHTVLKIVSLGSQAVEAEYGA
ncbi:MAG: 50S ribosomal protein L21 [Sphingomonadaceae bacterium]|nr:50S ribosomal protein L21 [Sphingomonadaceae bacterium]